LRKRRERLLPRCLGNPHILFGQIEIVRIAITQLRFVTGLSRQPDEKGPQGGERGMHRRPAQRLARPHGDSLIEFALERHRLFNAEFLEILVSVQFFKAR
jgi:hypothetical protein